MQQSLAPTVAPAGNISAPTSRTVLRPAMLSNASAPRPIVAARRSAITSPAGQLIAARRAPVRAPLRATGRQLAVVVRAAGGNTGGQVYVPAANGQIAARIVKDLLKAGCKVVAGVPDVEEASALVDLSRKLELLPSGALKGLQVAEVDPSDEESVLASMPRRGARVVVVDGDVIPGVRRADPRAAERLVSILLGEDAPALTQLALVTPQRGPGTGTIGFGPFGRGSASGSKLKPSKAEEAVADSGIDFVILRTGAADGVEESYGEESAVVLGELGAGLGLSRMSKSQVAAVAAQLMVQAPGSVAVEAAADSEAAPVDIATTVAEVVPIAIVEDAEEEEYEEEEAPAARGGFGGFGLALPSLAPKQRVAEVEEEEEEEEQPAPKKGGFGAFKMPSFGKKTASEEVEEEEEDEEEYEEAPVPRKAPSFGTFKLVSPFAKKAAAVEEEEEEEEEAPPPAPKAVRGRQKAPPAKPPAAAAEDEQEEEQQGGKAKKTGGGLMAAFGFGQKSVYVDEL